MKELDLAILAGDIGKVQECLNAGANLHEINEDGFDPLMLAVKRRDVAPDVAPDVALAIVKLLVGSGANVRAVTRDTNWKNKLTNQSPGRWRAGWTVLLFACENGEIAIVEFLIESGANVNAASTRNWLENTWIDGRTPLMVTLDSNHLAPGVCFAIVQLLVKHGANVNAFDNTGERQALLLATMRHQFEIANYLIDKGANIKVVKNGWTLPLLAIRNDNLSLLSKLIKHKDFDVTETDDSGYIALKLAKWIENKLGKPEAEMQCATKGQWISLKEKIELAFQLKCPNAAQPIINTTMKR